MMKELEYDFHDSIVVSFEQEKDNKFTLTLCLYEVYYPLKELVKITFSEVFNNEKLSQLFKELESDFLQIDWNGSRINSLRYDSKKISKDLNLYIFIDIDNFKPIRVHCKKVSVEKINNTK